MENSYRPRILTEVLGDIKVTTEARAPRRSAGISLGEAMRTFGISEKAIYTWEKAGLLLGLRVGNRVYYPHDQLAELVASVKTSYRGSRAA